jgi:SanA protein
MKTKIVVFVLGIVFLAMVQIMFCNKVIWETSKNQIFSQLYELPEYKTALVLGTSKYLMNGRVNLYFKNRIDKTVQLYKSGKINCIIVSGDNGSSAYDEPTQMKADLIKAGIPSSMIVCDYAGFRTLDSIVRAKLVFGCNNMVIISQKFHLERALYLAKRNNVKAVGLKAKDVPYWYNKSGYYRECLARVKAVYDVCLFNKQPKFLGEKVDVKRNEVVGLEM